MPPRIGAAREDLSEFIVDVGIGGHRRADVYAYGSGVDEFYMGNARGIDVLYMGRHLFSVQEGFQSRYETFKHHGGFSGARHPGDHAEAAFGDIHLKGLNSMDRSRGKMDPPFVEQIRAKRRKRLLPVRKEWPDTGLGVRREFFHASFRKHPSSRRTGAGPHFHYPVRLFQYLAVMIHQDHRVPVRDKVVHHPVKASDIGRMQSYRGFIKHI